MKSSDFKQKFSKKLIYGKSLLLLLCHDLNLGSNRDTKNMELEGAPSKPVRIIKE